MKALVHDWLLRHCGGRWHAEKHTILIFISATVGCPLSFSLQTIDTLQIYFHLITSLNVGFSAPDIWTASNHCFEYNSWTRERRWFSLLWLTRHSTNWLDFSPTKFHSIHQPWKLQIMFTKYDVHKCIHKITLWYTTCISKVGKGKGHPITGHQGPTGGVEV
jgi:hypothetical protein